MEKLKQILGEELFNTVMDKLKDNKEVKLANLAEGEYVAKGKLIDAETKANALTEQLTNLNKEFETMKQTAGSNTELKTQLQQWQDKYNVDTQALNTKLMKQQFDSLFDLKLKDSKAKNIKAAKALFDTDSIKLNGDNLNGFDEQLKTVKESNPFLFDDEVVF